MNILFVYSLQDVDSFEKPVCSLECIQFGIAYISSVLKKNGHHTRLVVLSKAYSQKQNRGLFRDYVAAFQPQLICFTAVSSEYDFVAGIARYSKEVFPNIFILIGGPAVTLHPDAVLNDDFDALCIGEGEYPTLELVSCLERSLSPTGIPNLWIKKRAHVEKNQTRPFMADIDNLPYPDRDMWLDWIKEQPDARVSVLLGRGCPFECTYCCNHAFKKISPGSYIRLRSPQNIINEIKMIMDRWPHYREVYLEVETFYINKQWAFDLCEALQSFNEDLAEPLSFGVNLRITPHADYKPIFEAMQKSNFRFVNIGLESGSERVRSEILKRNYSNNDIISAVTQARKYNLKTAFFNIIGIPGETEDDFKETVRMNRVCQPDWIMPSIFYPYPGTDLYKFCKTHALLDRDIDANMERNRPVLNLPGFTKKKIQRSYEWFYFDIYCGYKPFYELWERVLVMKLRRWPVLFFLYKTYRQNKWYRRLKSFFSNDVKLRKE